MQPRRLEALLARPSRLLPSAEQRKSAVVAPTSLHESRRPSHRCACSCAWMTLDSECTCARHCGHEVRKRPTRMRSCETVSQPLSSGPEWSRSREAIETHTIREERRRSSSSDRDHTAPWHVHFGCSSSASSSSHSCSQRHSRSPPSTRSASRQVKTLHAWNR